MFQIRWESCKKRPAELLPQARKYLASLEAGFQKRRTPLHSVRFEETEHGVQFKWAGEIKGQGELVYDEPTARVVILERSGRKSDPLASEFRRLVSGFQSHSDPVPWRIFGFEVDLPRRLGLDKWKFVTGRITLQFKSKASDLTAERWGLANTILGKHALIDWAKSVTGCAECVRETESEVELVGKAPLGKIGRQTSALVRHDQGGNRLLLLKATHRGEPPRWEWLR